MERLTRVIMVRMRQARRKTGRSAEPKVFALVTTSPTIDLKLRATMLTDELKTMGLRVATVGEEAVGMPAAYFDELENRNDVVLLLGAIGDTAWFKMTQRHADRMWVLARADARPSVPLLPEDTSPARQFRLVDLVLIHHHEERRATSTLEWKYATEATRVFHWDGLDQEQARRLARTMSGKSVGLVLSGGGARAYAHIGVIKALREASCPVDFVGGASMGAIIAAGIACGWDDEEMHTRIYKAFVESNPLSDYRLPVVGLVKGHKVDARLKEHFGDILIEDLPLPFFAVSTISRRAPSRCTPRDCCAKPCAPPSRCPASFRPSSQPTGRCWSMAPCSTTSRSMSCAKRIAAALSASMLLPPRSTGGG